MCSKICGAAWGVRESWAHSAGPVEPGKCCTYREGPGGGDLVSQPILGSTIVFPFMFLLVSIYSLDMVHML